MKTFKDGLHKLGFCFGVITRFECGNALALYDDLRTNVGFGLEQNGVHIRVRRHATSHCLKRLGAPNLAPIFSDSGVVGHVLRLEWAHAHAAPHARTRDASHQDRLAHI